MKIEQLKTPMAHDGYTLTVPGYEQKMEVTE